MHLFKHVTEDTVVWTNNEEILEALSRNKVGKEVRLCGRDGWPREDATKGLLVRLRDVAPPVPVSQFMCGEIVLSPDQLSALSRGGGDGVGTTNEDKGSES